MMKLPYTRNRTQGFINALLLALLLNLSGHMFLHLGDAVVDAEETHWTAEHEPSKTNAPAHPCAVCQDHQHLALDAPTTASYLVEAPTANTTQQAETPLVSPSFQRPAGRAPPRN